MGLRSSSLHARKQARFIAKNTSIFSIIALDLLRNF